MNPVLALGLVAAAGIAVTRLPRVPVRRLPHADVLVAAGTPLLLLGLLLGPGIGMMDRPVLHALAPVTALAIGWIGAVFGSRFEWRYVRRIPPATWARVLLQSVVVLALVGGAAWLLTRARPELGLAWVPTIPAVLTLAAAAAVSGPGAALDTAFGALAFTITLAIYHPNQPVPDAVFTWYEWLILAIGSGLLVGVMFLRLTRFEPRRDLTLPLLGTVLFGAGVGYAADLSPFVVSAVAAALIVNASPLRRRVRAVLSAWEHAIYAVFLVIAGALLELPTFWILVAVPVLAGLPIAVRWAAVRFGLGPLQATRVPPHVGVATVAQGGVALALGINFSMTFGGAAAGAVVTTIVLGMALAQLAAPPLRLRALRAAVPD